MTNLLSLPLGPSLRICAYLNLAELAVVQVVSKQLTRVARSSATWNAAVHILDTDDEAAVEQLSGVACTDDADTALQGLRSRWVCKLCSSFGSPMAYCHRERKIVNVCLTCSVKARVFKMGVKEGSKTLFLANVVTSLAGKDTRDVSSLAAKMLRHEQVGDWAARKYAADQKSPFSVVVAYDHLFPAMPRDWDNNGFGFECCGNMAETACRAGFEGMAWLKPPAAVTDLLHSEALHILLPKNDIFDETEGQGTIALHRSVLFNPVLSLHIIQDAMNGTFRMSRRVPGAGWDTPISVVGVDRPFNAQKDVCERTKLWCRALSWDPEHKANQFNDMSDAEETEKQSPSSTDYPWTPSRWHDEGMIGRNKALRELKRSSAAVAAAAMSSPPCTLPPAKRTVKRRPSKRPALPSTSAAASSVRTLKEDSSGEDEATVAKKKKLAK